MTADRPQSSVVSLFEADPVEVGDDPLRWIPVRRLLGIGAFGVNAYRADAGQTVIEPHVESPGQEELYVVVSGALDLELGDERIALAAGEAIFAADPTRRRAATARLDGTVVLAVGGWPDRPYHALPWEPIYLADRAFRNGDWDAAAATLEREAGGQRESPPVRYRLACCRAQLGDGAAAEAELAAAIEARPELRDRALGDPLLEPIRDRIRALGDGPSSA